MTFKGSHLALPALVFAQIGCVAPDRTDPVVPEAGPEQRPLPPVGLADDTSGVFLYTRRFRRNVNGECIHPPPDDIDQTFVAADGLPLWTYVGDSEDELVSFEPGDPAEVSGNPIDDTRALVLPALRSADDFRPVFSTNDGEKNFDAGTGGTITLRPPGGKVIRPDGKRAQGKMLTSSDDPAALLDGSEIFVFEDAEFSGYTVTLTGPTQTVEIALEDYQNDVVDGGFGDDTMLAIDLDTLAGFTAPYIQTITITDDGVSQGAKGRCAGDDIDTSLELDAVAVRLDVLGAR